jgi:DNA modification methylase
MKSIRRSKKPQIIETFTEASTEHIVVGPSLRPTVEYPLGNRQIELVSLNSLRAAKRNARTHSKRQIEQISNSMRRFGVINPIIVDSRNQIIAGHARAEACKLLDQKRVPVIRVTHLTELELRAYMLADNKLAEKSGWDRDLLAQEFEALQIALPEIDLDLSITGFDPGEIDAIFSDYAERSDPSDEIPEIEESSVATTGDLFILGRNRIIVGDARDRDVYTRLMKSEIADMAFLDPPYNVKIQGHAGGRGRTQHREFAHASGEMTSSQFQEFLRDSLGATARFIKDGAIAYVCMDWRHAPELHQAGASVFDELKNICVWTKTNPGQGSFYRSQHEFVFVFKRGKQSHINTFELGQHGRTRSNVWSYAGVNSFRPGRMDELRMHPTVKPTALIADAMKDCSGRGSIVLDSFAGSGTSILAAERVGRRAYCIEVDARYVDVAIRRWQSATRKDAFLESNGKSFNELSG